MPREPGVKNSMKQGQGQQIHAEMMQMFESGTFDIAHLDPWLRSFAAAE